MFCVKFFNRKGRRNWEIVVESFDYSKEEDIKFCGKGERSSGWGERESVFGELGYVWGDLDYNYW